MEGKARTKNNVRSMLFCALSILLEIIFIQAMMTVLKDYAPVIEVGTKIFGMVLVLHIYNRNQTATIKMPWVILILIMPVFGVTLYLLIGLNGGTRRMRLRYLGVDTTLFKFLPNHDAITQELQETDPGAGSISHYLAKYASYPVYCNTDVTYYDTAAKGLEAQLEALSKAEKFIFMEYHAIEDTTPWQRIQTVLEEKVKQGVEVRVFYDDLGSAWFINDDFARALNAKGIRCRVFNPFAPGLNVFLNNRDHRKITVVDGKVGFTGGYNLANEYFNLTHPYGQWKDTGIRLEGDAVRSMVITFLEMWDAIQPGQEIAAPKPDPYLISADYHAAQTGFIQPYAFGPMNKEKVGENVYIGMVEKAERYCWFITPYLIITDEMTHALCLAAKRGVDVRIVTPGIPDKKIVYSVTRSFYPRLAKSGVRIFEWEPGFCHAKMCVADDRMAVCGTINLDYRSLYHHFENGCFMAHCPAVTEIRDDLSRTMDEAVEVTEICVQEDFSALSFSQLLLRLFAGLL